MSVLAEFTLPGDDFVLAETLSASPDMRIEIKRVVGGTETVTPYFWASGGDIDEFERSLREDDMVNGVITMQEDENRDAPEERFYRVTWRMDVPNLVDAVSTSRATVLEAISDEGEWEVKVLFPDESSLSDFYDYCLEHGFEVEPTRIYRPGNPEEWGEYHLTEEQQEALEAAYRAGYFAVPRDHTMSEIADQLGISRNALSARLRRGHQNLLANTIIHEE